MFPQLGMSKNRHIASLLTRFFQQLVLKKRKEEKLLNLPHLLSYINL